MSEDTQLGDLALRLLTAMADAPERIEYNTRIFGGSFGDGDVDQLDQAYLELRERGLAEASGQVVSFFGAPKSLSKITDKGIEFVRAVREAS